MQPLFLHQRHHHYHVQTFLQQYQFIVIVQEKNLIKCESEDYKDVLINSYKN